MQAVMFCGKLFHSLDGGRQRGLGNHKDVFTVSCHSCSLDDTGFEESLDLALRFKRGCYDKVLTGVPFCRCYRNLNLIMDIFSINIVALSTFILKSIILSVLVALLSMIFKIWWEVSLLIATGFGKCFRQCLLPPTCDCTFFFFHIN